MKRNSTYVMSKIIEDQPYAKKAQIGVDLTIDDIQWICAYSVLKADSKIDITPYALIMGQECENGDYYWDLEKGSYAIEFDQGLKKLEPNEHAFIIQRSSLNRAGVQIVGSIYDPGFETKTLGATMNVAQKIRIYRHARVAQIIIDDNEPVDEDMLYNGTWQNKGNV